MSITSPSVRPSPIAGQVGIRDFTFEACSGCSEPIPTGDRVTRQKLSDGRKVRQGFPSSPDWQKKGLAFAAWNRARDKFGDSEPPSVATIQRSMVEILGG